MIRQEKIAQFEKMRRRAPEIMSQMKVAKFSPFGKNKVYELIKTKQLKAYVYQNAYIAKSKREKRKEIPVGIFNAKKTNNPRRTESPDSDCGGYFDDTNYELRGKERARFKETLEILLSAVPDTLTVDEVAELTGYHRRTILRYVQRKYIYAVNMMRKYYIKTEYH